MSESKHPTEQTELSVDEIVAEFSSKAKVVEFPGPAPEGPEAAKLPEEEQAEEPRPTPPPKETPPAKKVPEPMDEIRPATPTRNIAARLYTLFRRAEHYADHMYDKAEPDEETLFAEKYIPGVDREEIPEERPPRRKRRRYVELPPDTPPAELAARWQHGLRARDRRLHLSAFVSILCVLVSVDFPRYLRLDIPDTLDLFRLRSLALAALLLVTGLLCWDIIKNAIQQMSKLRPGAESVAAFAWIFTLLDCLTAGHLEARLDCLPCGAVTALGLTFHLWGYQSRCRANRLTAKTAAQAREPYTVTLDEDKWSGRPAYTKWSGSAVGFGSQLQTDDAGTIVYRFAAPLLLLAALLCSFMASVGQKAPGRFPWAASVIFTAAAAWSALPAYGLPFKKLAFRLNKVGAALAGWAGAANSKRGGIVITDHDLFSPGTVRVTQIKVFGGVSTEKVIGYTATVLRVLNCGLTKPFHDLLRTQGSIYREISGVRPHEGGVSGIIRNQDVLVGTAAFMHLMKVPMPQGFNVKNAVFCALDGELAGMFLLEYRLNTEVNPALSALMHAGVSPILATRDFNLIPDLLGQKFHLPVDKMEFPPIERRLELSRSEQEHSDIPIALLCREGLTAYSDAVVGGCRLYRAVIASLAFALLGAVLGIALTFYLAAVAAYTSLTPVMFMVFMALWLVPELLIANWVNQY